VRSETERSPWDGHLLLLHRSESERRSNLASWVSRGLEREEKVIYTEVPTEPSERSLLSVLAEHGVDGDAATRDGRLLVLPLAEFYPAVGEEGFVMGMLAEGFPALRVSAEANAALTIQSPEGYARVEESIDRLCRSHRYSALCQYDRESTTGDWLRRTVGIHVNGIREHQLRTTESPAGLTVAGEIDTDNSEVLAAAVLAATASAAGTFRLDLGRVSFMDVAGCRALVAGTEPFRDAGGDAVLIPSPSVARVARLLDVDTLPGFRIGGLP
jgi:anti-anti-sigma factor